jgi:predicted XRE-type DNA-binding protein
MEVKFLNKVNKESGVSDCWEWKGKLDIGGYGSFSIKGNWNKAHRISYQLWKGDIPKGLVVRHLCNNRKCVNPEHLETGTQKQNVADMFKTNPPDRRGEKSRNHKLNNKDIFEIRQWLELGYRQYEIADLFEIEPSVVSAIKRNKIWKHI